MGKLIGRWGKLTAWVTAAALLVLAIPVSAKTNDMNTAIFDLQSLGIVQEETVDLESAVTRAEFSEMVVRLMGLSDAAHAVNTPSRFSDVPNHHESRDEIELLAGLNLLGGVGDGRFEPESPVTLPQAAKVLVAALGYSEPAIQAGGYPNGYLALAAQLGLLSNVSSGPELTRRDVIWLLENALDIDRMISNGYTYEVEKGNTLRSQFAGAQPGVEKRTGIVTATVDTWLISPISNMTEDEIQIDGILYDLADPSARDYIGQSVDYYLQTDAQAGTTRVTSIKPTRKNQIFTVDVKDILSATAQRITYETPEADEETLEIGAVAAVVRNSVLEPNWTAASLSQLTRGRITCIDNDNDGEMDVILAEDYESAVVESVLEPETVAYFRTGYSIDGLQSITLAPDDRDVFVSIRDEEGNDMAASEVKAGDVLSAAVSSDQSRVVVKVGRKQVSGTVTEVSEDGVRIGEELYPLENEDDRSDFTPGREITAYLSAYGEIVFFEEGSSETYVYILDISDGDGGVDGNYSVKLLKPDLLEEKQEEVENEDGGEATTISVLSCRNEAVEVVSLANKVTVKDADGVSKTYTQAEAAARIKGQAFQVKYNADGQIIRLTAPEKIGENGSRVYNSYERTFGGSSVGVGFGVDEKTRTICIPKAPEGEADYRPSNDDYLVRVEMNNGQRYNVMAYDKDEETKTAGLIVVEISMTAGSPGILSSKSDVAMVNQVRHTVNEEGDEVLRFTLMTEEQETTYTISPLVEEGIPDRTDFSSVRQGDLIAYSLDSSERIDACRVLGSIAGLKTPELLNEGRENETFFGYLVEAQYDEVSAKLNRWIHRLSVGYTPDGAAVRAPYEVTRSNGAPVFLYYRNKEKAELGTVKQIRPGNDQIFVSAASGTVRAIVVIR